MSYESAQCYLEGLKYSEWYEFDEVPKNLWEEIFELIDENYVGWYFLNDDDSKFMKRLPYKK